MSLLRKRERIMLSARNAGPLGPPLRTPISLYDTLKRVPAA
jgi:hypothetical protein